jgi:hypothetical protein
VIHISDSKTNSMVDELNEVTGKDNAAAAEMSPEYVKSIMKQMDMLQQNIYPISNGAEASDEEATGRMKRLLSDPDLKELLKFPTEGRNMGSVVYMAVLADVYLGNPADDNSMWIARMRYALGMTKSTFLLTEKKVVNGVETWLSYMNDEDYLDLYSKDKAGKWVG